MAANSMIPRRKHYILTFVSILSHILGFLNLSTVCLFHLNYSDVSKSQDIDIVSTKWILDSNHEVYRFTIQQRFLDSLKCLPIYPEEHRALNVTRHQSVQVPLLVTSKQHPVRTTCLVVYCIFQRMNFKLLTLKCKAGLKINNLLA